MMENKSKKSQLSGVSVDVVMLAVIIALHVTNRDQNLKLILVVLLVVHVMATTRSFTDTYYDNDASSDFDEDKSADMDFDSANHRVADTTADVVNSDTKSPVGMPSEGRNVVTNSSYNRQFTSPPQLSKTRDVLPTTSAGANGKLVASRTKFYKDIIDV